MLPQNPDSQALHFATGNQSLAEALALVGFKLVAVRNVYTDGTLAHLNMPDAVTAKRAGRPGNIRYYFEQRDDLKDALAAWDATGEALKAGTLTRKVQAADDIVLVRAFMRAYQPFRDLWRQVPAEYLSAGDGEVVDQTWEEGEKLHRKVTVPPFKIVSEGLSDEQREKIFPKS